MIPYIYLETTESKSEKQKSLLFNDFEEVLIFKSDTCIETFFKKIDDYRSKGFWVAGYFDYGFGQFLDDVIVSKEESKGHVYAWFGVSKKPENTDTFALEPKKEFLDQQIENNVSFQEYSQACNNIKEYLQSGDTYQVNYTFKRKFDFVDDPKKLYLKLRKSQPTKYMACIQTGTKSILSFSPELFFSVKGNKITTCPMKGTIKRGKTLAEDLQNYKTLENSEKDKAENLMIVDLLRNDLGRVCSKVETKSLFDIEKYKTVYQMTSTIEGQLKDRLSLKELFTGVYPCGSITGAPKIRTMQIIKELEKEPRGVYTGAIGYLAPNGDACFNVAIRTIEIKDGQAQIGVGGGIVIDSEPQKEFDEAQLKSEFLNFNVEEFALIETMLWNDKGYVLKDYHIKRMSNSAEYFDYPFDLTDLNKQLNDLELTLSKNEQHRIRILLNETGNFTIEDLPINNVDLSNKIKLSSKKICSNNVFLYHKTTNREIYNIELQCAKKEGLLDYIFLNERKELTEGCMSNIFLEIQGQLYTPAVASGLLPGVLRQSLISQNKVKEKTLFKSDLETADSIFVGNSVMGLQKVAIG